MSNELVFRTTKRKNIGVTDIGVVVPTRNRRDLLSGLIENLSECNNPSRLWVIVVDSSDSSESLKSTSFGAFTYIHTDIKSAAQQRNIGIDFLLKNDVNNISIVSFLDDDVRVSVDYFDQIHDAIFSDDETVGISGIANAAGIDAAPRNKFKALWHSKHQGKITSMGVNVPVLPNSKTRMQTNWLIGCAAWRKNLLKETRFQSDFLRNSLFEDVIFSYQMSKLGNMYVYPQIEIKHLMSNINRPDFFTHGYDWAMNRHRLFEIFSEDFKMRNYWIGNGIRVLLEIIRSITKFRIDSYRIALGVIMGSIRILKS